MVKKGAVKKFTGNVTNKKGNMHTLKTGYTKGRMGNVCK